MFDIVIKDGQVYDGTGNPWTMLDIGIKNGKIVYMGKLDKTESKIMIDAKGLAVSPGWIDTHVHSDLLCTKPEIHKIKVLQGVTLEVLGQDGISVAPVSETTKPMWQKQLVGLNGDIGNWPWNSIEEYLDFLSHCNLAGNVAYLVPHGNIRTLVMGFEGRKAGAEEMKKMKELVEKGMKQGALGISTGLVYPPNVFSDKEELIEICKAAAKYDGCFMVHIRNESSWPLEALDEVIDVAIKSSVRLHISHFKVIGLKNREKYKEAIEKIDQARDMGIEVTFDQYPYTAASTMLTSILPPWVHDGGTEQLIARLQKPDFREKIKDEFENNYEYENWVYSCGWGNIVISSVSTEKNRYLEGKNVLEISEIKGTNPADAVFDLLIEENAGVTMVVHWGQEEDVMDVIKHPLQIVGSDGIFGGKPHPRLYGSFPRVLGRYVREKKLLTLSEAIRHMTGAAAQMLRLKDRGLLREGYWADVVVFDPDTITDCSTYENPLLEPVGIKYVLVNGELSVEDGRFTGICSGKPIVRCE
jgi:N-acyl-D-amino-acid deacylase